jgi:L-idonate 5-dehydrogenase
VIVCDLNARALPDARRVGSVPCPWAATIWPRWPTPPCDQDRSPAALATTRHGAPRRAVVRSAPAGKRGFRASPMVRELDYVGAFRAEREFDMAVSAIRSRRADVRPLITAQIPLARSREAFELALDRTQSTKVQLVAG